MAAARDAAANAYVPHSGFHVGAALICDDGTTIVGCNIESDSYGLTCCAERTTIFSALAQGHRRFTGLAVTCPDGNPAGDPNSVMPCGACRQVISEHCDPDMTVEIDGVGNFTVAELLPVPFTLN